MNKSAAPTTSRFPQLRPSHLVPGWKVIEQQGFAPWLEAYFLGAHPLILGAREAIAVAAREDWPVLIAGETGTGKDMAAQAIHLGSRRRHQDLHVVAVGGLGETAWSVLFGHRKGSFTQADRDHAGLFRTSHGSTLILEDVADLPSRIQPMLLRAIEHGVFRPLGEEKEVHSDVRVLSTTNAMLQAEVEDGRFRSDLYQRLSVLRIFLPALREHPEDLEIYVPHFLERAATPSRSPKTVSAAAMRALKRHPWPRNVRELEHALYRASAQVGGSVIEEDDVSRVLGDRPTELRRRKGAGRPTVELDRQAIVRILRETRGNKREAARRLGVAPGTFYRLVDQHQITIKQLF